MFICTLAAGKHTQRAYFLWVKFFGNVGRVTSDINNRVFHGVDKLQYGSAHIFVINT